MSAAAEVLREARKLVERGWTQDELALAPDGLPVSPESENAVCWCTYGALCRAYHQMPTIELAEAVVLVEVGAGTDDLIPWNDELGRTQAEVLDAFSKAIELAEAAK